MKKIFAASVAALAFSTLSVAAHAQVTTSSELQSAIDGASVGDTIVIDADIVATSTITVSKSVVIDGNGHAITADAPIAGTVLLIAANDVTVEDLTVDANGQYVQGIQSYVATNTALNRVTAKNAGKSGIMVNGSTVTVTDVTTSGNAWHGINVDQGTDVTTDAILTVAGSSSHDETGPAIFIDDSAKGSVVGFEDGYVSVSSESSIAYYPKVATVATEAALKAAVAYGAETINLSSGIALTSNLALDKAVVIDGHGNVVTAAFAGGASPNNAAVNIFHSDVTLKDLVLDGAGSTAIHGIHAYVVRNALLDSVTVKNMTKGGINVNGSTVTVNNVNTSGNSWGGINVDKGGGVTADATLTVTGVSSHSEAGPDIWVDHPEDETISVVDSSGQYVSKIASNGHRQYFLPETVVPEEGSSVSVAADAGAPVTVSVPEGVTGVSLDLSTLVASSASSTEAVLPVKVSIESSAATVAIPSGTTITADAGWNGKISAPEVVSAPVSPAVSSNETASVALAIKVGSDSASLTFDKAARLALPGQAGMRAGYVSAGSSSFTEISATCSTDDQAAMDAELAAGADCKIDVGTDLVVWTKHFTTFAAYSVSTNAPAPSTAPRSGGRSSSRGGGGSASPAPIQAVAAVATAPAGQVLGASSYRFSSSLSLGMSSDAVVELQERLRAEGHFSYPTSTGYFGSATLAAVKAYQAAKGVPSTGFVGPLTMAKLNEAQAAVSGSEGVSAKSFVELLISIGAIGSDKAAAARAAVAGQ